MVTQCLEDYMVTQRL